MLTNRQVSLAVGATAKWVDNTTRALHCALHTEADVRWLGLIREISCGLGLRLELAATIGTRVLGLDPGLAAATVASSEEGAVSIVVDVARFHARFGLAYAAALLDGPRRRGRPAPGFPRGARSRPAILVGAGANGVDVRHIRALGFATPARRIALLGNRVCDALRDLGRTELRYVVIGDIAAVARGAPRASPVLEVCYAPESDTPTRLAGLLTGWEAWPLGVSREYPFAPDEEIVAQTPVMALDTNLGAVVLRRVGEREFADLVSSSDVLDLGEVNARVLRIGALIAALRVRQRSAPPLAIPELEVAAVVLNPIN